jgi:bacteriocin-like protein
MGNKPKKDLEALKKSLKILNKEEMKKIIGGKNKKKWNNSCGGILPQ